MYKNIPELLSPAGTPEALRAAVQNGCDAVYLGGRQFGARHSAGNFSGEELEQAIDYAHIHGVNIYLTVNTLCRDDEIAPLLTFAEQAYRLGADAFIIQDMGVCRLVRKHLPDIPLHASTQTTAHSVPDLQFLHALGFTRVVLAREMPLSDIAEISAVPGIECEVFIHGALCVSYSGQCLFSSFLGGRSGNRGRCAQPCRLPYTLMPSGVSGCLLSPKDMMTLDILPAIVNAGVRALKIEGRMRGPDYVAVTTRMYREALDRIAAGETISPADWGDFKKSASVYGRGGTFSTGYYAGFTSRTLMNTQGNYASKQSDGTQTILPQNAGDTHKLMLEGTVTARAGQPISLTLTRDGISVSVCGTEVQPAEKRPISPAEVIRRLEKTGADSFDIRINQADIADGIFINIKDINELRRQALTAFEKLFTGRLKRVVLRECAIEAPRLPEQSAADKNHRKTLTVSVYTSEQLAAALDAGADEIYAEAPLVLHAANPAARIFAALPRINRPSLIKLIADLEKTPVRGFLARTWGQLHLLAQTRKEVRADYTLNVMNNTSLSVLSAHATCVTLSPELSLKQLRGMESVRTEVIVYGRIPFMTTRLCPVGLFGAGKNNTERYCKYKNHSAGYMLKDRTGKYLPLLTDCDNCLCLVLNADTLCLSDKPDDLASLSQTQLRLMFTTEDYRETREVIQAYRQAADEGVPISPGGVQSVTRGHFYRGVL